jgi:hypothetical protein
LENLQEEELDSLISDLVNLSPKEFTLEYPKPGDNKLYCAARIDYGEAAGYMETDLTYAGDLIGNAGETIVGILDKIKNMLGDFEYFYDIDGRFIF